MRDCSDPASWYARVFVVATSLPSVLPTILASVFMLAGWQQNNYRIGSFFAVLLVVLAYVLSTLLLVMSAFLPSTSTRMLVRCSLIHPFYWAFLFFVMTVRIHDW